MITINNLSPIISIFFDAKLLSKPIPKFRENSSDIWKVYQYIKNNLEKKVANNPIRYIKYLKLEKKFLELYERAKAKEKERETEKSHFTQMPFYYFRCPDKNYGWVFRRLKYR